MADTDDSLLREVEEDLRREKITKLWDSYGIFALLAAGLLVAGIVGFNYWQTNKLTTAQVYGSKYQAALQLEGEKKTAQATKAFAAISKTGPKNYQILALIKLAAAQVKAGNKAAAVAMFETVINDGGADEVLAGYARLQAAALRSGEADWTEMENRLKPLTDDQSSWRFSARELLGIAAKRAGHTAKARQLFQELLIDRQVPQSISARARIMLAVITAAGRKTTTSTKQDETPKKTPKNKTAAKPKAAPK